jgi:hypothetical protein
MPSFCGAFLRCRPARHRSGARGLMDALVAAWLDVMPDAFRPPVRDATQRGHAGLRRATLRYNGLVPAELAERTQPLTPVVSGTLCRLDHSHGRRPGLHPQARQAESPGAPGLSEYRHGDSKPRPRQAVEPDLACQLGSRSATDRYEPLANGAVLPLRYRWAAVRVARDDARACHAGGRRPGTLEPSSLRVPAPKSSAAVDTAAHGSHSDGADDRRISSRPQRGTPGAERERGGEPRADGGRRALEHHARRARRSDRPALRGRCQGGATQAPR